MALLERAASEEANLVVCEVLDDFEVLGDFEAHYE